MSGNRGNDRSSHGDRTTAQRTPKEKRDDKRAKKRAKDDDARDTGEGGRGGLRR